MRTLLILFVLIVVVGVCVGFYRGWFSVSTQNSNGKAGATISVDKDRIESDKDAAVDKAKDAGR